VTAPSSRINAYFSTCRYGLFLTCGDKKKNSQACTVGARIIEISAENKFFVKLISLATDVTEEFSVLQ
jgi:hypothetical protein